MLHLAQDLAQDQGLLQELLAQDELIAFIAVAGSFITAIVMSICTCIWGIMVSRSREQTKRELAAYVAQGTLNASQAVAILSSGRHGGGSGLKEELGRLVARIA